MNAEPSSGRFAERYWTYRQRHPPREAALRALDEMDGSFDKLRERIETSEHPTDGQIAKMVADNDRGILNDEERLL
jgi:hypothetical protein